MTEGGGIDYKLRPASPDDAEAAARIQIEGWRSAYRDIFPVETLAKADEAEIATKWRERLSPGEGRFAYVAIVGTEPVGVLAGGPPRIDGTGDAEIYSLYVFSWWRGRGIGAALMNRAVADLAASGVKRVGLWTLSGNTKGRRFFARLGAKEGRSVERPSIGGHVCASTLYAWADAAAAVEAWTRRNQSVEVRPAELDDAAGIARVQIDTWRAAYVRIMPERLLGEMNDVRISAFWAQVIAEAQGTGFCFVASTEDRVVGFASGGPRQHSDDHTRGEVYALYVLPDFQGRGVGRRLVHTSFERMLELGMKDGRIWTLRENAPARAFYARIGGTQTDNGYNDIGGIRYPEVAFDWPDLRRWKENR